MLVYGLNVLKEIDGKKVKKAYCSRKDILPILENKKIKYEFKDKKFLDNLVKGVHKELF